MDWKNELFAIPAIIVGGIALTGILGLGIGTTMRTIDHHYSVPKCATFSRQTGYETKFVDYNFWNYDCLAKTQDGKWIPTDRLREVNN